MIEMKVHEKYIEINKPLYNILDKWVKTTLHHDKLDPDYEKHWLFIRELECHPVKLEYCAHVDISKYWYPGGKP